MTMAEPITAYPLSWPLGRPRSQRRSRAAFNSHGKEVNVAVARSRLQDELDRIRASDIVLSTNVELRLDGLPRSGMTEPHDPGAALYFKLKKRDTVLACDKWDRVADNIVAISKHIEAMRGMERWGVGSLEQAFAGYQALPAPEQWWQVMGCKPDTPLEQVEKVYRRLALTNHPDHGGSGFAMARLNSALASARSR